MRKIKNLLIISIVCLLLFILILLSINNATLVSLDNKINSSMPRIETPNFITLSKYIGEIFGTTIFILLALILAVHRWLKKEKRDALFASFTIILGAGLVFILKALIQRARPLNALITETDFSFPSGHATLSFIFFGILAYFIWKKTKSLKIRITTQIVSVIFVLIISFSRLYLNVHWLSDILASFALAAFTLTLCIALRKLIDKIDSRIF